MQNRYILGPDDVRRTPAEHAAAFPPPKKPAPQKSQTAPPQLPQIDPAPDAIATDKPKGAKAK